MGLYSAVLQSEGNKKSMLQTKAVNSHVRNKLLDRQDERDLAFYEKTYLKRSGQGVLESKPQKMRGEDEVQKAAYKVMVLEMNVAGDGVCSAVPLK